MLLGGYGFPFSCRAFTMKHGNQWLRLSALGFSNKSFLILLMSPLLKCAHCPGYGFLGIWWDKTTANRVHFTGRHWRGKARHGLLLCGRFFEVAVVHFNFRWLTTAPLPAPLCSQAVRVSTHPVSASRLLSLPQL